MEGHNENQENEQAAEEVEEDQGFRDDKPAESAEGDSDDDNEVDEQRFGVSDARLKRAIASIGSLR